MDILNILYKRPQAVANISGSPKYSDIKGIVKFYQINHGVLTEARIWGLPADKAGFLAFHIHEGTSCTGNENDFFADALTHYNPENSLHPYHAGDMPPILNVNGMAFSVFLTNRFTVSDIIGKTVIIHSSSDDFTTQPSGNAGEKIAYGIIKPN